MSGPHRLVLLGATGSIGASALDVAAERGEAIEVVGLSCGARWEALAALAAEWRPRAVAIADPRAAAAARAAGAFPGIEVLDGPGGVAALAAIDGADVVLNAIVGAAGLEATLAALGAGRRVALANKESLVVGGELVVAAAGGPVDAFSPGDARLVPVDSEHSALWQLLEGRDRRSVRRVVLTASGGPFRALDASALARVTAAQALAHPTWSMGPKVTVDSATLANKGLEIIEARWLFDLDYDAIDVVVHPQSIVHGLVETVDGALFAELGPPDMRDPIRVALEWPARVPGPRRAELAALSGLTFEPPDPARFPALELARRAGIAGGTAPAAFNAANEVAVAAFLDGTIGFLDIPALCATVLDEHRAEPADSVATLWRADAEARARAAALAGAARTPAAPAG